jgi:heme-degrading monooxygenase HmoA
MKTDPVWVVIWWQVDREDQHELAEAIRETRHWARRAPGFIRAIVVRSLEGKRITIMARWNTEEDYNRYIKDPEYVKAANKIKEMINAGKATYEACVCEQVVEVMPGVGD